MMNDFLSKSKVESNNINSDIPKLENPEQSYIHRQIQKDETELADLNKDIPYYEINVKTAKTSLEFVRRNNTNDRSAVNEYNNRVDIYNKAISKRKNLVSNLKLNKAQYNKLVEEWNENVSLKKSNSTNTSNSILTESKQLTDSKKGLVEKVSNRIALAQLFFKDGYANYIGNFDSTTTQNGILKFII